MVLELGDKDLLPGAWIRSPKEIVIPCITVLTSVHDPN